MGTNFTAEQKNILLSMASCIELASDIAHAHIAIYVPGSKAKLLQVYSYAEPLTRFVEHRQVEAGREVRLAEEPLVAMTMQRNIVMVGMREYDLGLFAHIAVYPVCDSRNHCFAAVSFETKEPEATFTETALQFLRNFNRANGTEKLYRRLSSIDGLMIVDDERVIRAVNNTAKHIFSILGVGQLVGKRTNSLEVNWPLVAQVLETGMAQEKDLAMQGLLLHLRVLPVLDRAHPPAVIVIIEDITELQKKDEELLVKAVVIKEIHHRVKNNLQTIVSLLRLQERRAKSEETRLVLHDCINRVNSIAIVHEYLSQQDNEAINVAKVARGIYEAIMNSMVSPGLQLKASFAADQVNLPSNQATSIALVLNELLQNSLEHGFEHRNKGTLSVSFRDLTTYYQLKIVDDGCGLPPGFALQKTTSLGLKIIQTVVESDLRGKFTLEDGPVNGTVALVRIPKVRNP
jgi:two-component sensor histidine kinase